MRAFSYERPATPADAVAAFTAAGAGARYIAGGTTLFDLMKLNIERPRHLIDLTAIGGLNRIETSESELRFGTLATMNAVAADPVVARDYPVLVESLDKAASQALRNMATVGGNLLQATRCPYFRNGAGGASTGAAYPCNKRDPGSGCAAIGGLDRGQAVLGASERCSATSPGDWPVALVALDATAELVGPDGRRSVAVADLYRLPGDAPHEEFAIRPGEIILAITVPRTGARLASTYHKVRDRTSYAFALASAAVGLEMDGGRVAAARIALGGVATVPWRAPEAEAALVGREPTPDLALAAGRAAFSAARPGRHNAFKIELGIRTVADAVMIATGRSRT